MWCRALSMGLLLWACSPPHPTIAVRAEPSTVRAGESLQVHVTVSDFTLRSPAQTHALRLEGGDHGEGGGDPNQGHYHVYLDSLETNPILQDHRSPATVVIPIGTSTGAHALIVRLNHDDHRTIVPHVQATAAITVTR